MRGTAQRRTSLFAAGVMALPLVGFVGHAHIGHAAVGTAHHGSTSATTTPIPIDAPPPATTLVAAPDGSGEACTTQAPCSLTTAHAAAREAAGRKGHGEIDVVLEDGTYHLTRPLRLGTADSGTRRNRVVYRAADGATPILSGGRQVTGWRQLEGSKNWYADIPKGFDTHQLYIDGHRVPVASGLPSGRMLQTESGLISSTQVVDSWKNPSNVTAVFKGGNGPWTQTSCPITAIDGPNITLAEPCWHNLHLKALGVQEISWFDDPMGGFGGLGPWKTPTNFTNLYSGLSPGHWMIDRVAHRLYYQPRPHENPNEESVVVPALQTLLHIDGTPAHPVHDVTVEGLTFEYGTWTATDSPDGFPQMQADWYLTGKNANTMEGSCHYNKPKGSCPFAAWTRTPANVVLTSTSRVAMLGNTFTHLGGAGLDLYQGAKHDIVQGNEFTDIAAEGIQLGATNDPLPDKRYGGMRERWNTVDNNFIHDVANQYLGGCGIWIGYTTHSLITHNEIEHVPYTAISIGWGGWHQTVLYPDRNPNGNAYNVVSNNYLYDYMHTLGDGGAIYSNGSQATSWKTALQERRNVAYRGTNTDFTFYTDAASRYVKIGGNFAYFMPWDSFNTGGCHTVGHIRIFNNYFSQGGPAYPCFAYTDMTVSGDHSVCQVPDPSQAPVPVMTGAGLQSAFRGLVRRYRPEVDLVGPEQIVLGGGKVLISGSGFTPQSVVKFGGRTASKVQLLSANYLFATAPAAQGSGGTVPVTVTNAHGVSAVNQYSQLTYTANPTPCQASMGAGTTTALLS
ncbi:MAG TPA: right-handed parallel beta-helix repeat-containing protein [Mycobacteriales bacterium]|nr:right-handed parallel beta-helix repeat-containing protein [Mycobacteriales bacterium]